MDNEFVWVGIDIGTTSVKVSTVNDKGDELISRTENTNSDINSQFGDNGFEQCPQKILKVVESSVQSVISAHQGNNVKIRGFGVSGQMHGIVLWKKAKDEPTTEEGNNKEPHKVKSLLDHARASNPSHLYTWQDQRCSSSFLATLPKPSNKKLPLSTGHGCATLFWLSRASQDTTLEKGQFDCCGTIIDYFVYLLCGLEHPVTSAQLAASLGYFNQETMEWDSALMDAPEFPSHLMPTVVKAGTQAGVLQTSLSGWPSAVPVLVGMGDVQCTMAAVIKSPHQAAVNISTSIQLGFPVPSREIPLIERQSPLSITFFPYFNQEHLALCAGLNGGNAIKHFVECIGNWMRQLGFEEECCTTPSVFAKLQRLASEETNQTNSSKSQTLPSLTVRPTFYGERHDLSLAGEISNISLTNFQNVGHVFRCVCEGIVSHLSVMVPPSFLKGVGIQELLVCGSVPTKNQFVLDALRRVYGNAGILIILGNSSDANERSSAFGAATITRNILGKK